MTTAALEGSPVGIGSRDGGVDIARGIAMVLVVFGHALDGAQSAGHSSEALRFTLIVLYSTHVPLFFLISGILSSKMIARAWPGFLTDLGVRIIWPYLLWAFILLSVQYVMGDYTNGTLRAYAPWTILWHAPAVLWFLYVLCVGLLMLRLIRALDWRVILGIGVVCLLAPYVWDSWPQKSRFIGMFLIGAAAGPAGLRLALHPATRAIAAGVMAVTVWLAADAVGDPIVGYPAYHAEYIPAVLAGPVLVYALSHRLAMIGPQTLLRAVGRNTMAIFVTHILVTAGVRIGLIQLGVTHWGMIITLATGAGVLLPLWAATLASDRGWSRRLGWQ